MFVAHHRDIVETIKVGQALVRRKRRGEERRGEDRTEVKGEGKRKGRGGEVRES